MSIPHHAITLILMTGGALCSLCSLSYAQEVEQKGERAHNASAAVIAESRAWLEKNLGKKVDYKRADEVVKWHVASASPGAAPPASACVMVLASDYRYPRRRGAYTREHHTVDFGVLGEVKQHKGLILDGKKKSYRWYVSLEVAGELPLIASHRVFKSEWNEDDEDENDLEQTERVQTHELTFALESSEDAARLVKAFEALRIACKPKT